MATFDQRNQKVSYQYNAAGNINFGAVNSIKELADELQKLLDETLKAIKIGAIDAEVGADVEAKVKKAIIQSKKAQPDKQNILDNINGAKTLIEGIASAIGLVSGFAEAAELVRRLLT